MLIITFILMLIKVLITTCTHLCRPSHLLLEVAALNLRLGPLKSAWERCPHHAICRKTHFCWLNYFVILERKVLFKGDACTYVRFTSIFLTDCSNAMCSEVSTPHLWHQFARSRHRCLAEHSEQRWDTNYTRIVSGKWAKENRRWLVNLRLKGGSLVWRRETTLTKGLEWS